MGAEVRLLKFILSILVASAFLKPTLSFAAEYVPGEVIVKLRGKAGSFSSGAFLGKATAEGKMKLKSSWKGLNMHHFSLKQGESVEATVADLQKNPDVEFAEPNYIFRATQGVAQQKDLEAPMSLEQIQATVGAQAVAQTFAPIDLSQAWSHETPGLAPPIVAVIDTGIDYNHSVFVNSGALWTNPGEIPGNGIDDDGNGYIDDVQGWNFVAGTNNPYDDDTHGHGTHVSGIILGTTQDIFASPIAAAKIRIMPLKFLDSNGSGTTSAAVQAIYYAVNNGAKVINNSWGGGSYSNSLISALNYAYTHDVAVIAAAGNNGSDNDVNPMYPSSYPIPNIVSVAATSDWDTLTGFSNYGATTVHVASPGLSIRSTLPGNVYGYLSGTSMATPFVSGIAALIVRESPTMNGYQVKEVILDSAQAITGLSGKVSTGARINVDNSIVSAKSAVVATSQPNFDASSAMRSTASTSAAGCGRVSDIRALDKNGGGGEPPPPLQQNLGFFLLLLVMFSPVFLNVYLRSRKSEISRRRHPRYQISSSVKLKVGDRELIGDVSTISLGGAQLNTQALLDQGGIVTMTIASPDGKDQIQVQGRVVWREECKSYGVQFANAEETTLAAISRWTQSLVKA